MDALRTLAWHRLTLRLSNRRDRCAREHPLFIFKSIFKFACGLCEPKLQCDYLFHPASQILPRRIGRGQTYDLELVFPLADEATVRQFADGLVRQLEKQPRNFQIERLDLPERRTLADLERSLLPALDQQSDELCLDFVTPVVFTPPDPRRPGFIDLEGFLRLCTVHLARLYPELPWPMEVDPGNLELLPYFWNEETIWHESGSQGRENRQKVNGLIGPLYLRGDWRRILPLLLVCSELHTGYGKGDLHGLAAQRQARHPIANPQGAFRLRTGRTFFDRLLMDPAHFVTASRELAEGSDAAEELACSLDGGEARARQVAETVRDGTYRATAAQLFPIKKKESGQRRIALLHASEAILHRVLHKILAPVFDRMLEHASVGYRPGRSIETARAMLQEAIQAGAAFAVHADIETFFDAIDWEVLRLTLRRALPSADVLTFAAVEECVRLPAEIDGTAIERTCGLLQGSPLSPLLANLYLDRFDETMAKLGHTLIRYGDDFVLLTSSREQAERALEDINQVLAPLKLSLNREKTAITPLDLGFSFLGMRVPAALSEEMVERSALRKPLFVKRPYAFLGIDADSVVVRRGEELLARLPLHRVAEIVFLGNGAISTSLLHRCATLRIPVSFCSAAGWYSSTLKPDSRNWFGIVAAHVQRHEKLGEAGRLGTARRVVEAKLRNYGHWLRSMAGTEAKNATHTLIELCQALTEAADIESVRGIEGSGARLVFGFVNRLSKQPGFASQRRVPRLKPDRYNALLDMLYSLLFTRINVLTRSQGLNPYLGFLHSPLDHYESLVCDLQEPFRCRMDRLAVKLINLQKLTESSFELKEDGTWRLSSEAVGQVIEAFEREEEIRLTGDYPTLGQFLAGQVLDIRHWVDGVSAEPAFFTEEALGQRQVKSQNVNQPP